MKHTKRVTRVILCLLLCLIGAFVFASCSPDQVSFDLDFEVDGANYDTISTMGAETISMPDNPTKEGYIFDGWFWDKDVWEKPFTANSLLDAPLSGDMTVYAKFSAEEYTITYYVDGGTHENTTTYTVEDAVVLSDALKAGYTFLGWATSASASAAEYAADTVKNAPNGTVLYSLWVEGEEPEELPEEAPEGENTDQSGDTQNGTGDAAA